MLLTTLQFLYDIAIKYWQIGAVLCLKILLTTKNEHGIFNVTLASGMQSQFDCHTNHVPICTFDNLWLCVLILDFGYDMWDLPFISSSNSLKRRVKDGYYVQYKTDVIILQHSLGRLKTHKRRKLLFIAFWHCIKSWFVIRYSVRLFLC